MTGRSIGDFGYFASRSNLLAAALLTLLLVTGCVFARRRGLASAPLWQLLVLGLPLLLIVDATLFRDSALPTFSPAGVLHWSHGGWTRLSYDPWSSQVVENVALFAPAGFAWNLLRRRGLIVWIGLTGMSLLIETIQGLTGLGAPDVADLLANAAGAAVGVFLAGLVLAAAALRRGRRPNLRAIAVRAALIVAAAILGFTFATHGAAARQARLEHELVRLYSSSSLQQFKRWERSGRLPQEVFARTSVSSDGASYGAGVVTIRYPASFFGIERCVFATWQTLGFAVRRGSGRECTTFLG